MTRVHAALLFAVAISTCSSLHAVVPSRCSRIVASADPSAGPPRRVAIVVDGKQSQTQLVAAILGAQQKKKKITRSVGYDRLLNDIRADPVPLMIAAAAVAAAGPSLARGLRQLPQKLATPFRWKARRGVLSGEEAAAAAAARPDGALEDPRQLSIARRLLEVWRSDDEAASGEEADEAAGGGVAGNREAALGLAMLDFATKQNDDAAALRELTGARLLERACRGNAGVAVGALRKASTAASRQTLGRGREGAVASLASTVKEERCGALLLLSHALPSTLQAAGAPLAREDEAALAAVRARIALAFGLEGLTERTEEARRRVGSRLLRLEARRALRVAAGPASVRPVAAATAVGGLEAVLAPLVPLLQLERADVAATLMTEAREPMRGDLEAALREWVSQRPRNAFLQAARATRLAAAILRFAEAGASGDDGGTAALAADGCTSLRAVGLTSTARHAMYGDFVRAAALEEVEALAARSPGMEAFGVADAALLRPLLSVLPASIAAADKSAFESAARVGSALGVSRAELEAIARRLGLESEKAQEILDARV
jgi:hypothetical protein